MGGYNLGMLKKTFPKYFDELLQLGFNPVMGYLTTFSEGPDPYQTYAKKRLQDIEAGKDKMYKMVTQKRNVICKI